MNDNKGNGKGRGGLMRLPDIFHYRLVNMRKWHENAPKVRKLKKAHKADMQRLEELGRDMGVKRFQKKGTHNV